MSVSAPSGGAVTARGQLARSWRDRGRVWAGRAIGVGRRLPLDRGAGTGRPSAAPARALGPWVGTTALQTAVEVAASRRCQSTRASIIPPAGFGWRLAPRGRLTTGSQPSIVGPMGEPPKPRPVRVARTGLGDVVLL